MGLFKAFQGKLDSTPDATMLKTKLEDKKKAQEPAIISQIYYFVAKPLSLKLKEAITILKAIYQRAFIKENIILKGENDKFIGVKQLAQSNS